MNVGLTGGIASGKSSASQYFQDLGIPVISTDQLAQELLLPHTETFLLVTNHFGRGFIKIDGTLDRAKLRSLIIKDPEAKKWLENLLHPLIKAKLQKLLSTAPSNIPYTVIEIPLLVEAKFHSEVDRILVIDCSEEVQLQRLTSRDRISLTEAKEILNAQATRAERITAADDIVENIGSLDDLKKKIKILDSQYRL